MQNILLSFIVLALLCVTKPVGAVEFVYSGYLKSYALVRDEVNIDSAAEEFDSGYQSQKAMRFMAGWFMQNNANVEIHYEVQPVYSSFSFLAGNAGGISSTLFSGSSIYRYKDLDEELTQFGEHVMVLQNLDRLNYQYSNAAGDLTVGRQVVAFGSARFINPTDIFVPFYIQTLNQEYRVGIDALRYQAVLGDFSMLDIGLIIGKDAARENNAAFIRGKTSIQTNDIELIFIYMDEMRLVGGGLERAIGDSGFWFETAYMALDAAPGNYWRTSIGSDYALSTDLIAAVEYHYNGAGSNKPAEYMQLLSQFPYQKAGVFLLGKHYIIPAISWVATPFTVVNASVFFNLSDQSVFLNLSSEVSWTDNLYSDFGIYLNSGEGLSLDPISSQINLGSEFGAYPLSLYASLRYYF